MVEWEFHSLSTLDTEKSTVSNVPKNAIDFMKQQRSKKKSIPKSFNARSGILHVKMTRGTDTEEHEVVVWNAFDALSEDNILNQYNETEPWPIDTEAADWLYNAKENAWCHKGSIDKFTQHGSLCINKHPKVTNICGALPLTLRDKYGATNDIKKCRFLCAFTVFTLPSQSYDSIDKKCWVMDGVQMDSDRIDQHMHGIHVGRNGNMFKTNKPMSIMDSTLVVRCLTETADGEVCGFVTKGRIFPDHCKKKHKNSPKLKAGLSQLTESRKKYLRGKDLWKDSQALKNFELLTGQQYEDAMKPLVNDGQSYSLSGFVLPVLVLLKRVEYVKRYYTTMEKETLKDFVEREFDDPSQCTQTIWEEQGYRIVYKRVWNDKLQEV